MPKISQLPILTNITTGSIIPVVESSLTQKLTVGKLFEFLSGALDQTFTTEVELLRSASSITSSFNTFATASILSVATKLSTSSFEAYTSSNEGKWNTLGGQTGSFVTEAETGSFVTNVSMFLSKSVFDTYTGSAATAVSSAINAATSSLSSSNAALDNIQLFTSTFNSYTASVTASVGNIDTSSLVTTSSFNSYTASVGSVNTSSLATTGSNTFIGNQTITGSLNVSGSTSISGGLDIKNNGYSWSFESNGRTKIPNITFNSDRGTGMVGIKPAPGREFQIETSTAESSVGPWSFGLDGTLTAPSGGANITRVANLITTSSFNTFTSSLNSFTASVIATGSNINSFTASVNEKTGSYATTGSNQFNGNQTITGSLVHGLEGNIATGEQSHAEGSITKAIGNYSHAEGDFTEAKGDYSHAEGQETIASGSYSHAEGYQTIALANHQHVQGQYNITSSAPAAFIVGNGTDPETRSNLIHAAGNEVQITGSLNVSGSLMISGSGSLNGSNIVSSNTIQKIETISSASYAALTPPVSGTLYIII
jgi:hypothetical protein